MIIHDYMLNGPMEVEIGGRYQHVATKEVRQITRVSSAGIVVLRHKGARSLRIGVWQFSQRWTRVAA